MLRFMYDNIAEAKALIVKQRKSRRKAGSGGAKQERDKVNKAAEVPQGDAHSDTIQKNVATSSKKETEDVNILKFDRSL